MEVAHAKGARVGDYFPGRKGMRFLNAFWKTAACSLAGPLADVVEGHMVSTALFVLAAATAPLSAIPRCRGGMGFVWRRSEQFLWFAESLVRFLQGLSDLQQIGVLSRRLFLRFAASLLLDQRI
jgi:hypothetical protein